MPIYEYSCDDCGSKFEKLVRGAETQVACPKCGEKHVKQELSTFAAHANGRSAEPQMGGGCGAGMCRMPDVCGRN
jgi:putative FmdB family regulatory protein